MTLNRKNAVAIPPAKKQAAATMLPSESCMVPEIPCPLVQPPAYRAPNASRIPPMIAAMSLGTGLEPKDAPQNAGTHAR